MSTKKLYLNFSVSLLITVIYSSVAFSASNNPIKLNQFDFLSSGSINSFIITDDSRVLFNQITDPFNFDIGLFSTDINGQSDPVFLTNNEFQNFGFDFVYDPDNQRVLNLDLLDNGSLSTRSSSIDGSSSLFLSTGFNATDIDASIFQEITSSNLDGIDLYYFVENNILYSITVDGSSGAIALSPNIPSTSTIRFVTPLKDRQEIIFSVFDTTTNSERIYKSPINGASPAILLIQLPNNVSIKRNFQNTFIFNEDDSKVIFNTQSFDEESEETVQLYSLNLTLPFTAIPISSSLSGFSLDTQVLVFRNTVVYSVRNGVDDFSQLYSTNIDGSQSPILLDQGLNIPEFQLFRHENSPYVVYAKETASSRTEIFSTLIDGSSTPRSLRAQGINLPSNFPIDSFNIVVSQTNGVVFYISTQLNDLNFSLFTAPVDGSTPAILISPANAQAQNIQLGVNEKSVFYISENTGTATSDLIQYNLDKSNSTLLAQVEIGQIPNYQLSNDGRFIVYSTISFLSFDSNLFSVKLESQEQPLCFPIKAKNGNFITICL